MEKKMTKKEMFTLIATLNATNSAIVEFCNHEIELLDKKAATAKATAAKKKVEGDALTDAVAAVLTDELATIADIAAKVDGDDVTVSKVQYRLNQLVANGKARKEQVTVSGDGSKARKLMAYAIGTVDAAE